MIKTKDLYKSRTDCCGCESCAYVCPKKIIRIAPDYDGFLYPEAFNPSECIDCKLCLKVCPLKQSYEGASAIAHFGGEYKDESKIRESSSGGFATAIANQFINSGGVVYGVSYSDDFSFAQYVRCCDSHSLEKLRGSKYIQASKTGLYAKIKEDLKVNKVLLVGLPCEIHAAKILFGKSGQFYTAALICHGPISPIVQKEYITTLEKGNDNPIVNFTVRYKEKGWKPYFIKADYKDGTTFKEKFSESLYGIAFSEIKRPSCSECHFKLNYNSSTIDADLILGDFHGVRPSDDAYNKWGVSQASVMTDKGLELINYINDTCFLYPITPRQSIHYNKALGKIIKPRWNRNQFARVLAKKGLIDACQLNSIKIIDKFEKFSTHIMRMLVSIKKYLR